MKKARIVFQIVPNPYCRCYNTTAEISEFQIHLFNRPLRDTQEKDLEDLGDVGRGLVEKVLTLDGVDTVSITPYSLQVVIGAAFDWEEDDINTGIIEALKEVFIQKHEVAEEEIDVLMDWNGRLRFFMRAGTLDDDCTDEENDDDESPIAENNEL